jgi:hypothetical protein
MPRIEAVANALGHESSPLSCHVDVVRKDNIVALNVRFHLSNTALAPAVLIGTPEQLCDSDEGHGSDPPLEMRSVRVAARASAQDVTDDVGVNEPVI